MTKFILDTDRLIASESPDHLVPRGTMQDNSRNPLFNKKLYALFNRKPLYILDFGCSGGAFVKDCLNDGHIAVGLEGSDYSKKIGRAQWPVIPDNLLTCDITAPFTLKSKDISSQKDGDLKFDVITAWEFMEHISAENLPQVCENARHHLRHNGLWIMSIADFEDTVDNIKYHQTVQSREWWESYLESQGFKNHPHLVDYFGNDWVRGPLQGSLSFHCVLTFGDDEAPIPPSKIPYGEQDMVETGIMYIEQAVAGDIVSSLSLEYALLLLDEVQREEKGHFKEIDYWRALALLHLRRFEEAKASASLVLELEPSHTSAQNILAKIESLSD